MAHGLMCPSLLFNSFVVYVSLFIISLSGEVAFCGSDSHGLALWFIIITVVTIRKALWSFLYDFHVCLV